MDAVLFCALEICFPSHSHTILYSVGKSHGCIRYSELLNIALFLVATRSMTLLTFLSFVFCCILLSLIFLKDSGILRKRKRNVEFDIFYILSFFEFEVWHLMSPMQLEMQGGNNFWKIRRQWLKIFAWGISNDKIFASFLIVQKLPQILAEHELNKRLMIRNATLCLLWL